MQLYKILQLLHIFNKVGNTDIYNSKTAFFFKGQASLYLSEKAIKREGIGGANEHNSFPS